MTSSSLIDFEKLPNKSICGLTDNQIQEIISFQAHNLNDSHAGINDNEIDDLLRNVDFDVNCFSEAPVNDEKLQPAGQPIPYEELDKLQESAVPRSTAAQQRKYSENLFFGFFEIK